MTFVQRPRFNTHKNEEDTFTSSKLFSCANRFLSNQSSASARSKCMSFNPSGASRRPTALMYEHRQVQRYVRVHQIRHHAVIGSSSNRQGAICQCSLGYSLHMACVSSSFSLLLPSWSSHRERCSTLPPFQWFHSAFALVSMFTTSSDKCLFLLSVLHLRRRLVSTNGPSSCSVVWDPWSVEYQSCRFAKLLW